MRSEKQVPEAIEDSVRKIGAPIGLFSDNAKSELHGRTKDLLRMYEIDDAQSEPHCQHQNPAERKFKISSGRWIPLWIVVARLHVGGF